MLNLHLPAYFNYKSHKVTYNGGGVNNQEWNWSISLLLEIFPNECLWIPQVFVTSTKLQQSQIPVAKKQQHIYCYQSKFGRIL